MNNIIQNFSHINSVKTKSFTLIELLIVVSIIGIIAAIAIPNFMDAILKAEISSTYSRMKITHSAIFDYMLDHQMLPPTGLYGHYTYPAAFLSLTTPVRYLDSVDISEDRLRHYDFQPNDLAEKDIKKMYFSYDAEASYRPIKIRNDINSNGPYYSESYYKGIRYLLTSAGPDGGGPVDNTSINLHNKYADLNLKFVYSSTNGLRSFGNIISTNVKTYQ